MEVRSSQLMVTLKQLRFFCQTWLKTVPRLIPQWISAHRPLPGPPRLFPTLTKWTRTQIHLERLSRKTHLLFQLKPQCSVLILHMMLLWQRALKTAPSCLPPQRRWLCGLQMHPLTSQRGWPLCRYQALPVHLCPKKWIRKKVSLYFIWLHNSDSKSTEHTVGMLPYVFLWVLRNLSLLIIYFVVHIPWCKQLVSYRSIWSAPLRKVQ